MRSEKSEPRSRDAPAETDEVVARVPVVEERAVIDKRVDDRTVRVRTTTATREEWIDETVEGEDVSVERVAIDRVVEEAPTIRREGELTVIPVVEEVLVVEKRLVLREEIHIRKTKSSEVVRESVTLRKTEVTLDDDEL